MRKSTIFISTILTTFALVMLYGVVEGVSKYFHRHGSLRIPVEATTPRPEREQIGFSQD